MTDAWVERQTRTPEARREYERERLIVECTDKLYGLMEDSGLAKADLARSLGTSRANITQAFGGRNLTLRTLSDFAWACGHRVSITLEPLRDGKFISAPVYLAHPIVRKMVEVGDKLQNVEVTEVEPLAA